MENLTLKKNALVAVQYSEDLRNEWDAFIQHKSINGTFLHSRGFFDHNPENSLDDASIVFYIDHEIIAVFPANLYLTGMEIILHSHLRATYGGIVVSNKVDLNKAIQIIELIILFARKKKANQVIIRNPFRIFNNNLCDETDYAMWFYGFKIKSRELEIAVPLQGSIDKVRAGYHNTTRRNIKKALKSVRVKESKNFGEYWVLLEKCLFERHGQNPVHDFDSIIKLRENVGEDKILLFGAYYEEKLIAGIVVFDFGEMAIHSQYIAADFEFQHLRPVHAIVDFLVEWGNKRNVRYFNLGMANEEDGKKINTGLFRFKESFGGRGVLRETMYLDLK